MPDIVGTPILEAPLAEGSKDQHMVLNMGPQHPSTHGVLRLVLEIDVSQRRSTGLQEFPISIPFPQ